MPSTNGKQTSVQPRFDDKSVQEATSYLWTFWDAYADPDAMPAWGSPGRADKMRQFSQSEPILIGALSSMTSKAVSLDWQISGGRNRVLRYQELLAEAEAGAGWSFFLDRWLQDYHVADQGGFIELGRQGKRGPVIGLYNLDAGCCQLTTRQKSPMAYYPRVYSGAIGGKRIPFEPGDYARIVDMPSPNEAMGGLGFSACSRAFKVAKVLQALYAYEDERLRDMPIPGIAAITGMTSAEVKAAFNLYEQKRQAKEQVTFKGVLWLAAQSSPINPIDVKLTSFASLPEGFDKRTTIELYVYTLALDFGVDVREFWPASQTGATKAEAEVQAEKAKGKGMGRMLSSVERALNWDVLPEGLEFGFDQKDSTDDLLRETIREKVIANIAALAGGQIVSIEEARRWLVELEMAPEWLAETDLTTVHGSANVGDEDPEVVEQPEPVEAAVPAKTPAVVDQAVAAKAARARLGPGEDFVAVNGAGNVVTLWSSRRVFAARSAPLRGSVPVQKQIRISAGTGEIMEPVAGDVALGVRWAGVMAKYDPDQPRDPAGTDTGGQWTAAGSTVHTTGERVEVQYDEYHDGNCQWAMNALGVSEAEIRQMFALPGFRSEIIISTARSLEEKYPAFSVQTSWLNNDGAIIGECTRYFVAEDYGTTCYNEEMHFDSSFQDQDLARKSYERQIEVLVKDTDIQKIRMIADVSIGRYAWAKMGFQYQVPQLGQEASEQFKVWAAEKNIDLSSVGWPEFKTPQDVANYKVPGVRLPSTNLSNPDIKPGEYEVGKAFMLDKDGHGSWSAVLWLKK